MTKLILIALIVSLPSFAQNADELTLESTTAPTVMEDGTDLSQAPMEEPVAEAPESPETVETVDPAKDIPAQLPETSPMELTNKSVEDKTITEPVEVSSEAATDDLLEEPTETAAATEEVPTPNPIADEKRPEEKPVAESIVDQAPSPKISTPVITTEAPDDDRYIKHRASHWITTFGFEGLKYDLPWNFEGERRNVRARGQELYGARLGIGGQLYLGAGFFTTSKVEGFYVGTLTKTLQVASPDVEDEEAGSIKRTGGLWGGEIAQQLGFMFEFRTKNPFMDEWAYMTFEPFIEAGLGVARAYNSVDYQYDTTGISGGVKEFYKVRMRDELTNARVGAGFNMTGRTGFFFQAKVSVNRYDITDRKIDSYRLQNGGTISTDPKVREKDVKIDPITVFSVGGGYKF